MGDISRQQLAERWVRQQPTWALLNTVRALSSTVGAVMNTEEDKARLKAAQAEITARINREKAK